MNTSYIRLCKSYDDPVWGTQILPWIKTPLIRVFRNRLRRAVFEWVSDGQPCDIAAVRRNYPIVTSALESGALGKWGYLKTMPIPG